MSLTTADFPAGKLDSSPDAEAIAAIALQTDMGDTLGVIRADDAAGNLKDLRYYLNKGWKATGSARNWLVRAASWTWDKVTGFFRWIGRGIRGSWRWTKDKAQRSWYWVRNRSSRFWAWSKAKVRQAWVWTKDKAQRVWAWTKDHAARTWNWTKDKTARVWNWSKGFLGWCWSGIKRGVSAMVSRPLMTITGGAATAGGLALLGVQAAVVIAGIWLVFALLSGKKEEPIPAPLAEEVVADTAAIQFSEMQRATVAAKSVAKEEAAQQVLNDPAKSGNAQKQEFSQLAGWSALLGYRLEGALDSTEALRDLYRRDQEARLGPKEAGELHFWNHVLIGMDEAEAWLTELVTPKSEVVEVS